MANPFNTLADVAREYQRYNNNRRVMPAIRLGDRYMALETVYNDLIYKKIRYINWYLTTRGISIKKSNTSESLYFRINGISFRISDHKSKHTAYIDHSFIIRYDSCVVQTICHIKMAHFRPE